MKSKLRQLAMDCRDYATYFVVRLIICIVQCLSLPQCEWLSQNLAWLFGQRLQVRSKVVRENLLHAFPELSAAERTEIEHGMWLHLFRMICELAHARRKIHETNWRDHFTIRNRRELVRGFIQPKGQVAVTAHFGNFEMSGYISGLLGFPTHTIARPLDNRFLNEYLFTFRAATGQFVLPTKNSGEDAIAVLDSGETLALLGDHFGGRKGCWVEFFNRPASCHKAVAVLSLANQVPMSVVTTHRRAGLLQFELAQCGAFDPSSGHITGPIVSDQPLDTVPTVTEWYNRHIEAVVRRTPDQYWWLHRRWKDPRRKSKKAQQETQSKGSSSAQTKSPAAA